MASITSPRDDSPGGGFRPNSPSLTGTPTSSVRPSIDLPRNGTASSPSPATSNAPTQRRNRAALRDYYNLAAKGAPSSAPNLSRTTSIASNASDSTITSISLNVVGDVPPSTAQLDDPSFEADKYIAEVLKRSSLRDLLRIESTLVSEVRNLDGERKALVYDNYSKLIKAVGTIGDMQRGMQARDGSRQGGLDGVEKLEKRLKGLIAVVEELRPEKEMARGEGRRKRERKRQRELVNWLLTAPVRLAGYEEDGDDERARKEWAVAQRLLGKWAGVDGVEEVRLACEEVMKVEDRAKNDGG